jgi:hypothetical protein
MTRRKGNQWDQRRRFELAYTYINKYRLNAFIEGQLRFTERKKSFGKKRKSCDKITCIVFVLNRGRASQASQATGSPDHTSTKFSSPSSIGRSQSYVFQGKPTHCIYN